ncbi:MAG: M48 family metallopeptidase [Blastocatellales bacterium]
MRINELPARSVCLTALLVTALPLISSSQIGQTGFRQGFNLFSPQQEIEIGRHSITAAEKHLPLLQDESASEYISRLGQTLITHAPGERYPYSFKVANIPGVNAFAFPGGPIYITRGTIEAASSEGELAGVIAHEIAHVALRHGASQVSKAYLAHAGIGALGGVSGEDVVKNVIGAMGGFGFNTIFLRYTLEAESEADALGARIMACAGYDPREMTSFFRTLHRRSRGDVSKLQTFLGDHPSPESRVEQMEYEAAQPGEPQRAAGNFSQIQTYIAGLPRALDAPRIARRGPTVMEEAVINQTVINVRAERPSSHLREYWRPGGSWFRVAYPENWRAYPSGDKLGVTFTPPGGVVESRGQTHLIYGAVINQYKPIGDNSQWTGLAQRSFRYIGGRGELTEATNDLIDSVLQNNPHLDFARGSDRRGKNNGSAMITLTLTGRSPLTGRGERAQLYTRELDNGGVIYAIFVAPDDEYDDFRPTFDRMLRGLKIDDGALQRDK